MTDVVFLRGMALLAATWPDRAPTADTVAAYSVVLKDLHDSVFESAIAECLRSCTFYPRPAEILAKAEAVLSTAGVLPKPAEEAWQEVIAALGRWSPDNGWLTPFEPGLDLYGGPEPWSNELVADAVRAVGGMAHIHAADHHDLGFIRRDFITFYEHKREQEIRMPALLSQPLPTLIGPGSVNDGTV